MSLSFQYRLPSHFAFHWLSKVVPTGTFKTRLTMVVSRGACKKDRVGSTPTRSIFITLVNDGVVVSSILTIVGQY
jgi:hypothetical protein